ncbi:MAG: hypothetical protein ACT4P9_06510 [Betaproteobacteria bacterium]
MRRTGMFLLAMAFCGAAWSQKWVDEKGKVYYGEKPPGVKVKPAEMKGGGGGTYSTEDLTRKLQQRADLKSAQTQEQNTGPRHVGQAREYKPDMPRGGPLDRKSLQ